MKRRFVGGLGLAIVATLAWINAGTAYALTLEAAESPSTSLSLTVAAIQSARESLLLNIYELSSSDVADALLSRIRAGVHVEIIEEGQPVGGMSAASRGIQTQLVSAMRDAGRGDHLFEMSSHAKGTLASKRRFHYDHAKYAVIDGKDLLIGSENYSPTGNPHSGIKGNRGWEVLIHDGAIAVEFAGIFKQDSDMTAGDLIDRTITDSVCAQCVAKALVQEPDAQAGAGAIGPWTQPTRMEATSVARITAPDTSLSGLLALLNSAQKSIDIQQMTFDPYWGKNGGRSPLLSAVIEAARRGVRVRVLLNDEKVFTHPGEQESSKNLTTIKILNDLAESEGLELTALTANLKRMGVTYIHNKGVLVDGDKTLISSINWGNNAVLNNREAAVLITGTEVFDHYETLFTNDWAASGGNDDGGTHSLLASQPSVPDFCPDRMKVSAEFGSLRSTDPENTSFQSLSGTHFASTFVRTMDAGSCILSDMRSIQASGKRRFIEIRRRSNGDITAVLEGYTRDGTLYSVRTFLSSDDPLNGVYEAWVFDGSGPAREKLGNAVLGFQAEEAVH